MVQTSTRGRLFGKVTLVNYASIIFANNLITYSLNRKSDSGYLVPVCHQRKSNDTKSDFSVKGIRLLGPLAYRSYLPHRILLFQSQSFG